MRALDTDFKLQVDSLPEITHGLEIERNRLKKLGHNKSPYGLALMPTHVLNAWCAYVLDQPPEERERIFKEGFAIFIDHAEKVEPVYFSDAAPGSSCGDEPEPGPEPGSDSGNVTGSKGLTPRSTGQVGGKGKAGRKHKTASAGGPLRVE